MVTFFGQPVACVIVRVYGEVKVDPAYFLDMFHILRNLHVTAKTTVPHIFHILRNFHVTTKRTVPPLSDDMGGSMGIDLYV